MMKHLTNSAALVALLAMILVGTSSRYAAQAQAPRFGGPIPNYGEPLLVEATVTFHTNGDDKDADTRLDIVLEADHRQVASAAGIYGRFPDHTNNGPFALRLENRADSRQTEHGVLHIYIRPNGHDRWLFGATLVLRFANGTFRTVSWRQIELNQNTRHGTLTF